jgi:hypothetical protein
VKLLGVLACMPLALLTILIMLLKGFIQSYAITSSGSTNNRNLCRL